MITDKLLRLSEDQAITATAVSTNTIPLSVVRDVGEGTPLYMVFTITEALNKLTDLTFNVLIDNDEALGSPSVLASKTVTLASGGLAIRQQHVLQIPPQFASLGLDYLGASYTVNGTNPDTGKITTDIVTNIQDQKYYSSGFSLT